MGEHQVRFLLDRPRALRTRCTPRGGRQAEAERAGGPSRSRTAFCAVASPCRAAHVAWQSTQSLSLSRCVVLVPLWSTVAAWCSARPRRAPRRAWPIAGPTWLRRCRAVALEAGPVLHVLERHLVARGALHLDRLVGEDHRPGVPEPVAGDGARCGGVAPRQVEHAARPAPRRNATAAPAAAAPMRSQRLVSPSEASERCEARSRMSRSPRLERVHQLDRDRAVEARGRRLGAEAVRADVDRARRLRGAPTSRLARDVLARRRLALEVHEALAVDDHALVERHARVGQVDLAARVAPDAQPLAGRRSCA